MMKMPIIRAVTVMAAAAAIAVSTSGMATAAPSDVQPSGASAAQATESPVESPSHDGAVAVAKAADKPVPAAAKARIAAAMPLDGSVAESGDTMTALPSAGDKTIEMVSSGHDGSVTMDVVGMTAPKRLGNAVKAENSRNATVVQATENGVQIINVAKKRQASVQTSIVTDVPEGANWLALPDGGLRLDGANGAPIMVVDAPWAVDAHGVSLPTSFTVENGTITQVVDTAGAVFPVVSDPSAWWWVSTSAMCVVDLAPFFLPTVAAKAARLLVKAKTIINRSARLRSAIAHLGGLTNALRALKTFIVNRGRGLSADKIASIKAVAAFGLDQLTDALGVGSCSSLVKAIVREMRN
jgi:hypothetical protein